MEEIRNIIQMGIWVELYTIPPYMTAMLSLKREKFKEVYNILKSVSTEEMLHMVLNANVLNSIGGKPNTTDTFWLPDYPTTLPSMGFYQIRPDITLTIAPFSRAIVKDVFMEIEKPASPNVMTILHNVALMWARLPGDAGGRWKSFETEGKTLYADTLSRLNASSGPVWLRRADSLRSILDTVSADEAQTEDSNDWRYLFQTATELLENPEIADVYTIGGFYAHAMLRLIQAEACVKM
uniref:Iminophenyl-pyruvate dimer synthase domain-containing protein n=4 Tax=Ciona intestinalis TaxID=7719 RepID=F6TAB1_CIOIN